MRCFQVEQDHPTVVTVKMAGISAGWEQWMLLRSDAHHDNTHADHKLEQAHLEQAKERNAGILDFGDCFDVMQGKWDKRADQNQLRPELRGSRYQDAVVEYNSDFYLPYADHFILLGLGNHETAFQDRHETCLTTRMAERLKCQGSGVRVGGYQGWVRFQFLWNKTKRKTTHLRYTHGYGGGGPVTKDVIQAHRQMAFLGNADILVSGHTHDKWHVRASREVISHSGIPVLEDVDCLKCGGYKDEYSPGKGWACSKGMGPKPLGGWWLRFWLENDAIQREITEAR